jgi:DNA-binding SARP family transcriptional activator
MAAGRRNFHPTLSYIRRVLPPSNEPPILRGADVVYRLNPAYPLTCDAWELETALEDARRAANVRDRRAAFEHGAALATGPFLEGLYADWAEELQARTRDRIEKLSLDLGSLCAKGGDFPAALEQFRRAMELDEFREATRLAVMECLMRLGNRRAALAEYDKLKALLRTELAVDPLPETDEGVRQLLAHQGVHGWPEPGAAVSGQTKGPKRVTASTQVRLKQPVGGSSA